MATWFKIEFEGEPTEEDFARVAELAAQGCTSGQLLNEPAEAVPLGYAESEALFDTWRERPGSMSWTDWLGDRAGRVHPAWR